jgi:hypothetical protein
MPKLVANAHRPGRFEPRVRKRRSKQYPVMQKPRSELRKILLENGVKAQLSAIQLRPRFSFF